MPLTYSQMEEIKFEDYKARLLKVVDERLRTNPITGERNGFTLIEGFFNQPFQKELTGSLVIGGPALPLVALVGNSSGRIYFFALKILLPDIKI